MKRYLTTAALLLAALPACADQVLFESGTLGQTGVVPSPATPAANISQFAFNGSRFQLTSPARTSGVGGHFVGDGTFFGAIVQLADGEDFPDSEDLSSPDVLGAALITFSDPSSEVSGDLTLTLLPGDYALVFGSGLLGATGDGGALLNNPDVGTPDNIGLLTGFGWGDRPGGFRFFLTGVIVPEPSASS